MNYPQSIDYLNQFLNFERQYDARFNTTEEDIERFRLLLKQFQNPQNSCPVIHIAGTKGKGSTGAMLTSILTAASYKTGFYTSPHLISVRERISINGRPISRSVLAKIIQKISDLPESIKYGHSVAFRTVFEHLTAAAFIHFMNSSCQAAIIEAGMGARLDTTVVVEPTLSILTPIGLDHTSVLGDTITKISEDKIYVAKPNVPLVTAFQTDEAMQVIERRAKEWGFPLIKTIVENEFHNIKSGSNKTEFYSSRKWLDGIHLELSLPGSFQLRNLSTVLNAVEVLNQNGFRIQKEHVAIGLAKVKWDGRLQHVQSKPFPVILDGGHNAIALQSICESLRNLYPKLKWKIVFGALKGKPVPEMLQAIEPIADEIFFTKIRFPKSYESESFREIAKNLSVKHSFHDDAAETLTLAQNSATKGTGVLVIGSLYLIGEILRHLRGLPKPELDGFIDNRI